MNSNFVPSLYHSSSKLQYYVTEDYISLSYGKQKIFYTDIYLSINTFMSSFFLTSETETVHAYTFENGEHFAYGVNEPLWNDSTYDFYYGYFQPAPSRSYTTWSRINFYTFLAALGGFSVSVKKILAFLLGGYQSFAQQKTIVQDLYRSSDHDAGQHIESVYDPLLTDFVKKDFKERIDSEEKFTANYVSYLIQYLLRTFCCCLMGFCGKRS